MTKRAREVIDLTKDDDDEAVAAVAMGECVICMEALSCMKGKRQEVQVLECCHAYHLGCLVQWIHYPERRTCPTCRQGVSDGCWRLLVERHSAFEWEDVLDGSLDEDMFGDFFWRGSK